MDFVIVLVILAVVVLFISAPLRRAPAPGEITAETDAAEPQVRELEAARDAKLRELRDAELDHRTGKLSDEDYHAVDTALRAEALEILRALDDAREHLPGHDGQKPKSADTITG
jgi:Na+-transporting methylmalonyl-CoA/oxaloacetate decarboxylase gamma subunit